MSGVNGELIETYLKQYGWSFHADGKTCWVTGWQSEVRSYPLIITLTDTWVNLTVAPFVKLGMEWEHWPEVMRLILELNHQCKIVKLGIDEFGDLSMSIYLFAEQMNFEQFSDAIGVLGHYADELYDVIMRDLSALGFNWNQPTSYLI